MNIYLKKLAKYRLQLALITVLIVLFIQFFVLKNNPLSPFTDSIGNIGFIIVMLGVFLRSWAAGIISKNKVLTKTGPYSICRHPLYLGSLLMAIGFILIISNPYLWIILVLFMFLVYLPKIKGEEVKINQLFPNQYDEYKKETGMLYPKSLSLKKIMHPWSFKQWWHHTEYNAWIACAIALAVLHFWTLIV